MKYPYCSAEMRAGYIQGARGVIFSEEEKVMFVVRNPFSKKDKTIADAFTCAAPAFYCDTCDCMIWKRDYSAGE